MVQQAWSEAVDKKESDIRQKYTENLTLLVKPPERAKKY